MIGGINTFSTAVFASVFARFNIDAKLSFVLGYILSLNISYFLNTYFTFKEKPSLKKYIKFPVSYIPNFLIQFLCVWLMVDMLGLAQEIAYFASAVIGAFVTFLVMKLFVFGRR